MRCRCDRTGCKASETRRRRDEHRWVCELAERHVLGHLSARARRLRFNMNLNLQVVTVPSCPTVVLRPLLALILCATTVHTPTTLLADQFTVADARRTSQNQASWTTSHQVLRLQSHCDSGSITPHMEIPFVLSPNLCWLPRSPLHASVLQII